MKHSLINKILNHKLYRYCISKLMAKYTKAFVEGYGVRFDKCKKNPEAFESSLLTWPKIYQDIDIKGDSIIAFMGAKNNGKSSLTRYCVNRFIVEHSSKKIDNQNDNFVYYVDFDPGQPEMTTPGCISAHIIRTTSQALLSPTYLNNSQHERIIVTSVGGTNMSTNPHLYIENCRFVFQRVLEHRNQQPTPRPIFINTMGHVRNVGLAMQTDIIKSCNLTHLIVLNTSLDPLRSIHTDLTPPTIEATKPAFFREQEPKRLNYTLISYSLDFLFHDSAAISNRNRAAQQLAYLATMTEALFTPILQLEPKWISLHVVTVHCISSYPLKESVIMELLPNSWVQLGKTIESKSLICDVLGCGIVKSVDLDSRKVSVITPLDQEVLDEQIDCLIKPLSIQVPLEILQAPANKCYP